MAPRTLHQAMAYLGLAEQTEPVRETRRPRDEFDREIVEEFDDTRGVSYGFSDDEHYDDYAAKDYFAEDQHREPFESEGSVREDVFEERVTDSYRPASHSAADRDVLASLTEKPRSSSSSATGSLRVVSSQARQSPAPSNHHLATSESEEELRRITTIHPRSYNDAKIIGESFRENIPVIMNVTDMGDSEAKRLVDFSAGLAFALHGSIERVTDKVFLLTPANLEVLGAEGAEVPVALDGDSSDLFNQD